MYKTYLYNTYQIVAVLNLLELSSLTDLIIQQIFVDARNQWFDNLY